MAKIVSTFFFLAISLFTSCSEKDELTTFILVRHAEKADDGTDDPDLTAEGEMRAKRLAFMLKDTRLDAVYSTNFKRTRNTAQPIADTQNIPVQLYAAHKPGAILQMLRDHRGGTVLVSGHSDNIPWTANLLLGRDVYSGYSETQYGTILIVSVAETNNLSAATRLNY